MSEVISDAVLYNKLFNLGH